MRVLSPSEKRYRAIGLSTRDPVGAIEFWQGRASRVRSGVEHLMLAVMADAIDSVRSGLASHVHHRQLAAADDQAWFASDDSDYVFAFETICDYFDFDASAIRRALAVRSRGGASCRRRSPPIRCAN